MNPTFTRILAAGLPDRRDLFVTAARRLGTNERNVEKDFWVCWTLDALFNGLPEGRPRLLFKGGTSLSKAFKLIARFSEDIDVTVFRDDLGQAASVDQLEAMSGKQRRARLDAIRDACREYINGALLRDLGGVLARACDEAGLSRDAWSVVADRNDPDHQTLVLSYPSVTAEADGYVRPAVRIESGAKSALDPNAPATVTPYVADDLDGADLSVPNITTVDPRRTFWDKVVILHGLRRWFDNRGVLRQEGQRISRHYYDVHRLLDSDVGRGAVGDPSMATDCARHARMFFNRPDFDLESAAPGRFALVPAPSMMDLLRRDYERMAEMIFGPVPDFASVIESVSGLEARVNAVTDPGRWA
ncbi:MAG: nucleotidyl transferase AbiEii/AbiGii toxin family protein [Burkholderiales bacterium]